MKKREAALARRPARSDPFAMLRQMTSDFDQLFADPFSGWPFLRARPGLEKATYFPDIDVFERDGRLITKIDLPGMKKEDVKVEINDGNLAISGERKTEAEEEKEGVYRCEREYGSFFRTVPLPADVTFEDVKATFVDGVLEISVPIPARAESPVQKIEIREPEPTQKSAA